MSDSNLTERVRALTAVCEVKCAFVREGVRSLEWILKPVAHSGGRPVRCPYCQGEIRLHWNRIAHGPQDHFEHTRREDSEGCRAGVYFDGESRPSDRPIT